MSRTSSSSNNLECNSRDGPPPAGPPVKEQQPAAKTDWLPAHTYNARALHSKPSRRGQTMSMCDAVAALVLELTRSAIRIVHIGASTWPGGLTHPHTPTAPPPQLLGIQRPVMILCELQHMSPSIRSTNTDARDALNLAEPEPHLHKPTRPQDLSSATDLSSVLRQESGQQLHKDWTSAVHCSAQAGTPSDADTSCRPMHTPASAGSTACTVCVCVNRKDTRGYMQACKPHPARRWLNHARSPGRTCTC